jgi:2-desacetyl-2-hydroxyethyl bacteriochlorophyllide A dehydrogenase
MKAVQIKAPGVASVVDVPQPRPNRGELLLRVMSCALCNQHDANTFYGRYRRYRRGGFPRPPGQPGHEGAGVVAAVGEGVDGWNVGDRVAIAGGSGLYAEYVVRPAHEVVRLPPGVAFDHGAPLELAACVLNAVRKAGDLRDKRVAVSGLGPAGLLAVQLSRILGATEVAGIEPLPARRAVAAELGADLCVSPEDAGRLARPHVVIDCSGNAESIQRSFRLATEQVVLFGYTEEPILVDQEVWFASELTVHAARVLGRRGIANLAEVVGYLADGRLNTATLVTHRLPLEAYAEAVALVERAEGLKVVLHVAPHPPDE